MNLKHLIAKTQKEVAKEKSRNSFRVGQQVQAPDPHGKHVFRHGVVVSVSGDDVTIQFHCTHAGSDSKKSVLVDGKWVKETVIRTFHFSEVRA